MTKYRVLWSDTATNALAEAWIAAKDRQAITAATEAIDQELCYDAGDKGIERHEGFRSLIAEPLVALFSVEQEDKTAIIWRIRLIVE